MLKTGWLSLTMFNLFCVSEKGVVMSQLPDPAADVRRWSRRSSTSCSSSISKAPANGFAPSPGADQSAKPSPQTHQSAGSQASPVPDAETTGRNWHQRNVCARCCQTADRHQDNDTSYGTSTNLRGPETAKTHRGEAQDRA